jgi:hypothetical protein
MYYYYYTTEYIYYIMHTCMYVCLYYIKLMPSNVTNYNVVHFKTKIKIHIRLIYRFSTVVAWHKKIVGGEKITVRT